MEDIIIESNTMTPAWVVCAWPPLLWQATDAPHFQLAHLGTRVLTFGDDESPCCGQTLWGDANEAHSAGVAWDWVEIHGGIVAMSDPLGLVTNIRLLDAKGETLPDLEAAVRLNQLVHELPWQNVVRRALGRLDD